VKAFAGITEAVRMAKLVWAHRRSVAGAGLYWSGAARLFEAVARPSGAIVVVYHSVASDAMAPFIAPPNRLAPDRFEAQMTFLRKHRNVVSVSALVDQIEAGHTPPAGTVCITFDDGYLDNLTVAAPILERHGLPATLYLPTGYIDRAEPQWSDVLHWAFRHRSHDMLQVPSLGLAANLSSEAQRELARAVLHPALLEASYASRTELLADVVRQLEPDGSMPQLTMNWDDVRELRRRHPSFDVGGHSRDHIDLRTHGDGASANEIVGCLDTLRRELGDGARHFAYPYNRWNAEARACVEAAGWRSAVCSDTDYRVQARTCRHSMPRIETPTSMTSLRFTTSGAFPGAFGLIGRG
jgi:peptidoglycan/xylan/chitin deacetylase (PgdA/CDA1 family)